MFDITPYNNFEAYFKKMSFNSLPMDIIAKVLKFKHRQNACDFLLLKNNDIGVIPPTPTSLSALNKNDFKSEDLILSIAAILGDPVSYIQEYNGQIINNIFPVKNLENTITSNNSNVDLELHTENAFHKYPPDYLLLLCLRQDTKKEAVTNISSINDIVKLMSKDQINYFKKKKFNFYSDYSADESGKRIDIKKIQTILKGPKDDYFFKFDPDFIRTLSSYEQEQINYLKSITLKAQKSFELSKGDLLIIDNNRAAHSRSRFNAFYDGSDRWLQRLFVLKDRNPLVQSSHENTKIIREIK
ncbi:MAG: TauD/TfdA family dioxygenase [Legionellaceae bacterium]|nr:TauD/TfdA family dioxygenase [Legionellaceae bacterium]